MEENCNWAISETSNLPPPLQNDNICLKKKLTIKILNGDTLPSTSSLPLVQSEHFFSSLLYFCFFFVVVFLTFKSCGPEARVAKRF